MFIIIIHCHPHHHYHHHHRGSKFKILYMLILYILLLHSLPLQILFGDSLIMYFGLVLTSQTGFELELPLLCLCSSWGYKWLPSQQPLHLFSMALLQGLHALTRPCYNQLACVLFMLLNEKKDTHLRSWVMEKSWHLVTITNKFHLAGAVGESVEAEETQDGVEGDQSPTNLVSVCSVNAVTVFNLKTVEWYVGILAGLKKFSRKGVSYSQFHEEAMKSPNTGAGPVLVWLLACSST